jgi:hypothetical protein
VTTIYRAPGCIPPRCVACDDTRPAYCSVVRRCAIGIVTEAPAPTDPSGSHRGIMLRHVVWFTDVSESPATSRLFQRQNCCPMRIFSEFITIRNGRPPSGLPTRLFCAFAIASLRATCPAHLIFLDAKSSSHEAPCYAVSSNPCCFQLLRSKHSQTTPATVYSALNSRHQVSHP